MKRVLVLLVLLFFAVLVAFVAAGLQMDSQKENIVITENTLYGNPEATAGLRFSLASDWDGHLLWDTSYVMSSGETVNNFVFSSQEVSWEQSGRGNISMNCVVSRRARLASGSSLSTPFDPDEHPLSELVGAMMEQTEAGEQRTERVFLKEYYEYYPLMLELNDNNYNVHYNSEMELTDDVKYLTDYFRIPVCDKEIWEITLEKDEAGEVTNVQCYMLSGLGFTNLNAFGREGAYHSYYLYGSVNVNYKEEAIRTGNRISGVWAEPGENYGIYYYPYKETHDYSYTGELTIDPTQVKKVCDLEPGIYLMDMILNETEDWLYLVTEEEQDFYLSVYEVRETGLTLRQKLFVQSEAEEWGDIVWCRLCAKEEGVLMVWQDGSFGFMVCQGEEFKLWRLEQEPVLGSLSLNERVWDFDGERLALASFSGTESVSVSLAVYTEEGLAYHGICERSGGISPSDGRHYDAFNPFAYKFVYMSPTVQYGNINTEFLGIEWE